MKNYSNFLFMFLAIFMLLGSENAISQTMTDTWTATPSWNAASYYRGFAYGNNRLYVGGRPGGTASVEVVNALTGADIKSLSHAGILDLTFDLADAEFSDDGSILAAPLTLNASVETGWGSGYFTIYRWANEDSDPEPFIVYTGAGRVDMFTVVGDVSGDAVVMGAVSSSSTVFRYIITGGVIGDVETITIDASIPTGTVSVVYPTGLTASDGFWYDNLSTYPTLCDNAGVIVGSVPGSVFEGAEGNTGQMKAFSYDSKDYLLVADNGKACLVNITGKQPADLTVGDVVHTTAGVFNLNQDVTYRISPDGALSIYSFSANSGMYSASTEAAPVATDLELSGLTLVDEVVTVNYTYADINDDVEGSTEIKWYLSDDAEGTNMTEITGSAGSATYTCLAGDVGKYISFSVLPLAATGTASHPELLAESKLFGPIVPAGAEAPVASDVLITGPIAVNETLIGSYTYSDANGDLESGSEITWYTADDATGTNKAEVASGALTYLVQPADANKYILFSVTPITQTGVLLKGDNVTIASDSAVFFPEFLPVASNLSISGKEEVDGELTGDYTYTDLNGDAEGASIIKWIRADDEIGTNPVEVATATSMYTVVAGDEGKHIIFQVTPVNDIAETGVDSIVATGVIAAKPAAVAPVATDVVLSGTPETGVVLSAVYEYFDEYDAEGASIFKWYAADDASGTNAAEIAGADDQTYLVTDTEVGKFIAFEVTPVALTGDLLTGTAVKSNYTAAASIASTQTAGIERLWLASSKADAVPFYLNAIATTERGFAVGSENIYIASRNGATKVIAIDKNDGSFVKELSVAGITGGIYPINDIEVSDDGQILAAPLNDAIEFWVYKWADELSDPVKWLTVTLPETMRLGDKFSVTGDVSGNAIIMAAKSGGDKIVRWVVTGGIAAEAEILTLNGLSSMETSPAAVPFSASTDANILIDGKGLAPRIFDKDMNQLGSVARIDDYTNFKIQSNSPNVFQYKGRTMAAFFQAMRQEPLGARIIIADITSPPYQIVDSSEYVSNSMAWDGYLGEVDVTTDGEYYYAYLLQAKNAVAAYRGQLELPKFASGITNHAGDTVNAVFDMVLADITTTNAAVWTITSAGTEIVVDSIINDGSTISFILASSIAEGDVVTIAYDGLGSITSFNGMPLAAFGPSNIENIVGAEPPVAADVAFTGEAREGQTLTGSYTYSDPEGDLEGDSEYQWWYATDAAGTDKLKIIGEFGLQYTVSGMDGKYIAFEVTPVSLTGGMDYLVGTPVMSDYTEVLTVGINLENFDDIRVYPNPVADLLTIENCEAVKTMSIIDVTGKNHQSINTQFKNRVSIDMSEYSNGLYYIKMQNDTGLSTVIKVVKIH